jgi:PKD repeat protein
VKLLVKDDDDAEGTAEHSVTVVGNAPPTAAFSSDCTDLSCSFTDGSTDPDGAVAGWSWEFGDGAVSTEAGPSHHYAAAGSYTVRLTVTDDEHASGGVIHQVTVAEPPNGAPVAAFSRSCNNLACSFSDQSTDPDGSIKTRSWTFGDGGTATGPNPSHTYAGGGSKTVTLTVTDNRDQPSAPASQTFTVAANLAPTVAFTSSCSGLTCSFTNGSSDGDGSIVSRSWNFGDGATSTSNSPSRTYAAGGSYTVRLTVTDDDGATATLTRSITVTAPVTNRLPTALFGSACTRLNCTFTDRSTDPDGNSTIVAWSWTFGDGTGSTARNPTHAFRAGGSYKVKLTVTDNRGGADPITHTVTVTP